MRRVIQVAIVSTLAVAGSAQADILAIATNGRVFRINELTGERVMIGVSGLNAQQSLARDSGGRFFTVGLVGLESENKLYTIDPDTGAATLVTPLNFAGQRVSVRALAFSPDDTLYAAVFGRGLWRIDTRTGEATFVGSTERSMEGLTFSPDGTLYGFGSFSEAGGALGLVTIDPATGAILRRMARIGDINTLAFALDGTLYAGADGIGALDPTTGLHIPGTSRPTGFEVQGMEFLDRNAPLVDTAVVRPVLWLSDGGLINVGLAVRINDPAASVRMEVCRRWRGLD